MTVIHAAFQTCMAIRRCSDSRNAGCSALVPSWFQGLVQAFEHIPRKCRWGIDQGVRNKCTHKLCWSLDVTSGDVSETRSEVPAMLFHQLCDVSGCHSCCANKQRFKRYEGHGLCAEQRVSTQHQCLRTLGHLILGRISLDISFPGSVCLACCN